MYNYSDDIDFSDFDIAAESSYGVDDTIAGIVPEHFQHENRNFEFEAMTEVPVALAAYVSHQHTFDL